MPEAVIQLGYPPARIDLLTAIDVADFKINKQATGRHKDLADLEVLSSNKVK